MERLDNAPNHSWLKVLVTGRTGTGKSWFGSTAPKPLILISEYQGKSAVESAVAARGMPIPLMIGMKSSADYESVVQAFRGPRDKPFTLRDASGAVFLQVDEWPETVVIDSLTDAFDVLYAELLEGHKPDRDKYGLPEESFNHKKSILDRCTKLVRQFRNIPAHVIFLALLEEKDQYQNRQKVGRIWQPKTPHKDLPGVISSAVNVCAVSGRKVVEKDNEVSVEYLMLTEGPPWQPTKRMYPLRKTEDSNFSMWVDLVRGCWNKPLPDIDQNDLLDYDATLEEPTNSVPDEIKKQPEQLFLEQKKRSVSAKAR